MFGASVAASQTSSSSSGNSNQNSNTRRLSVEDEEVVRGLMNAFGTQATTDGTADARSRALQDVQGSIEALFQNFSQTALPQIGGAQRRTGGYNSTTAQLLANDAFARTTAQAAALTVDTINRYETTALAKQQNALAGLSTSLQTLLGASETSNVTQDFSSKSKSNTVAASAKYGLT